MFRYNHRVIIIHFQLAGWVSLSESMTHGMRKEALRGFSPRLWLSVTLAVFFCACAATPTPDATGPRPDEPPYPVTMTESAERRQATLAAWEKLAGEQGVTNAPAPELQPVTASVRNLPANTQLYLPKVGDPAGQSKQLGEDATTESLRRFIESNPRLFGADPQQLSLVLLTDAADGTKKAKYQQRPFRYPLRNGFGEVEISFTNDRRILQITSTGIPEIEQLQRAGAGIRPKLSADDIAQRITGSALSYTDTNGNPQSLTIQAGDAITSLELVVYPLLSPGQTTTMEFHLAWEAFVSSAPKRAIYVDAVTGEIIAVTPV